MKETAGVESPPALVPWNRTAHLYFQAAGNPPSAHPSSAISNAFPGLEMDFRNAWRRLFVGIVLHEASNVVVDSDPDAPDAAKALVGKYRLLAVVINGTSYPMSVLVKGPRTVGGDIVDLPDQSGDPTMPIEWSNGLADAAPHAGEFVTCVFGPLSGAGDNVTLRLRVRPFFEKGTAVISREIAPPGELSQSLCSPWQNDYRECACFYWAASRPDYVNVEIGDDGTSIGNNWMQKDRTDGTPPEYIRDDRRDPRLVTYDDLFREWEKHLRFEIGGKDES